jgi:hypothetical protein
MNDLTPTPQTVTVEIPLDLLNKAIAFLDADGRHLLHAWDYDIPQSRIDLAAALAAYVPEGGGGE